MYINYGQLVYVSDAVEEFYGDIHLLAMVYILVLTQCVYRGGGARVESV